MSSSSQASVVIDTIGGNCPVQAEGTIDGVPFYFRARGDSWSLGIGADPVGKAHWEHREWFGEWPDAGWMSLEEAAAFLHRAADRYARGEPGGTLEEDPLRLGERKARFQVQIAKATAEWTNLDGNMKVVMSDDQ